MKKQSIILILLSVCSCLSVASKAQSSKCDSFFIIKVYDSAKHKLLRDASVRLATENGLLGGYPHRRGIFKFHFKDGNKINLVGKQYLFSVYSLGYNEKRDINLAPDCHCVQKVYLRRWTKEEADWIIKNVSVRDSIKR